MNIVPGKPFVVELAGGKSTTLSGDSVSSHVIVRATDVIIQYKAVMDLQESFSRPSTNKSSKKSHSKVTENSVALPVTPQVVVPPPKQKKDETNAKKGDVTCCKCLVKGHVAPNYPNAKHPKST